MFSRFATNNPSFFFLLAMFTFFSFCVTLVQTLLSIFMRPPRCCPFNNSDHSFVLLITSSHFFLFVCLWPLPPLYLRRFDCTTFVRYFHDFASCPFALYPPHILHRAHFFGNPQFVCRGRSLYLRLYRGSWWQNWHLRFTRPKLRLSIGKLFCVIVIINGLLIVKIVKVTVGWLYYLV